MTCPPVPRLTVADKRSDFRRRDGVPAASLTTSPGLVGQIDELNAKVIALQGQVNQLEAKMAAPPPAPAKAKTKAAPQ